MDIVRAWTALDAEGKQLGYFQGEADQSLVGTDWFGTTVASVLQLPDEEYTPRPVPTEDDREAATLDRISALELATLSDTERDTLIARYRIVRPRP